MRAVGFGDPVDVLSQSKASTIKKVVALRGVSVGTTSSAGQLPPTVRDALRCHREEIEQELAALEGAPSISTAISEMSNTCTSEELITALETAASITRNLLNNPGDVRMYRVKRNNPAFHRCLGRFKGSSSLMRAIGFIGADDDSNHAAFVLKTLGPGFDASAVATAGSVEFKFPSLDSDTEKFLYRRKADLDQAIRSVKNSPKAVDRNIVPKESGGRIEQSNLGRVSKQPTLSAKKGQKPRKTESKEEITSEMFPDSLGIFLADASAARKAQIKIIYDVFRRMDVNGGELSHCGFAVLIVMFRWRCLCERPQTVLQRHREGGH